MKRVIVYTKSHCPYCVRAKKLLEHKNIAFEEISLENDQARAEALFAQTGFRTVPQIFIGDNCIGGCDDLMALEKEKKLDSMLL